MLATFATLILAALTYNQNTIWRDPITFYRNILDHGETSVRAHNNLGIAYMNLGNYTAAMEQLQLALQSPAPVAETHQDIAALLAKNADGRSHLDEEIIEMKRALDIKPDFAPAYDGLADIYGYKGDKEQARFYRQKADLIRQKFQR